MHTIVTLTDNAPQGLNQALSVVVIYPCIFEGDMGAGFAEMRDETSLRQSLCDVVDELAGHINAVTATLLPLSVYDA